MIYQCDSGYEPNGPPEVVCTKTGEWSMPQFQCVPGNYYHSSVETFFLIVVE